MSQPDMTREELMHLEARIGVVENEVDGEKLLSRYILNQARQNGDDLAALKTRVDRVEEKVDRLERIVGRTEAGLNALRKELPAIVAQSMREVMRESKTT